MLGFSKAAGDTRCIIPGEISRPYDRGTASAIMTVLVQGKAKNAPFKTDISAAEFAAIKAKVQAGAGYDGIPELNGPDALARINSLEGYFRAQKVGPKGEATIPDFLIDAIWSEPHRKAAQIVSEKFGKTPAKATIIDNGALKQAIRLADENPAALARAFQDGNKKALYAGSLTDFIDAIRDIRDFMATGRGGLCNHGPVYINGERFDCVIPLPEKRGIPRPAVNRPEDERQQMLEDMFNKMVGHYDPAFAETTYDRVYIKSDGATPEESRLFVCVRDRGAIKNITYENRASFIAKDASMATVAAFAAGGDQGLVGELGEVRLTGQVVWMNDVPNTVSEASTGFLKNLIRRGARKNREAHNPPPTLPGLAPTGGLGVTGPGGPAPYVGGAGARGLGVISSPLGISGAFGVGASASLFTGAMGAAAYFGVQNMITGAIAAGIVSGAALLATIFFFQAERMLTPKSINPILNAAGLSVQNQQMLAEQF